MKSKSKYLSLKEHEAILAEERKHSQELLDALYKIVGVFALPIAVPSIENPTKLWTAEQRREFDYNIAMKAIKKYEDSEK